MAISMLLPTFDDWTYFTTPYYDFGDSFINRLIPRASYWRPWDTLFGYVLSLCPSLFPILNHIVVYTGHVLCSICIYNICQLLRFNHFATVTSTLFFFLSPAMLGTVLDIDSLNQTYSELWGLVATWIYLRKHDRLHLSLWLAAALTATFAKENGISFFIIPQILAWGFNRISLRQAARDTILAIICMAAYFAGRNLLDNPEVAIIDEYTDCSLFRKLKNIAVFIGMTWIPLDYVSLIHKPSRNIPVVVLTVAMGMPFIIYLFTTRRSALLSKPALCLILCWIAAGAVHLVTLFTSMHAYASLGMASLLVAYLANKHAGSSKVIRILFAIFIANCLFVDWHHWDKAYYSGLTAKNMTDNVLAKVKNHPKSLYIINIDYGIENYSMFCVKPFDAFGWGGAVMFRNEMKWPVEKFDTTINVKDFTSVKAMLPLAKGYEGVWFVHGDTIDIIR